MFGLFKKAPKFIELHMPTKGQLVSLDDVPDVVFSQKMVGDGFAVIPESGLMTSPVKGKVIQIFPTNHAIGIKTPEGVEVLIHIGIDTVQLKGQGFKRLIEEGTEVNIGTPLVEVDLNVLKDNDKAIVTPVIVTNMETVQSMELDAAQINQTLDSGVKVIKVILK